MDFVAQATDGLAGGLRRKPREWMGRTARIGGARYGVGAGLRGEGGGKVGGRWGGVWGGGRFERGRWGEGGGEVGGRWGGGGGGGGGVVGVGWLGGGVGDWWWQASSKWTRVGW